MIDTHVHVWWRGDGHRILIRERIERLDEDFRFERLLPDLPEAGVDKVILVSAAQSFSETQRLLAIADTFRLSVAGVVGFLDMESRRFERDLDEAIRHPALVGLRLPLVTHDDPGWIRTPCVAAALGALADRGLVAQVLAAPVHLAACADVLAKHPDLVSIIDHAGNPGSQPESDALWRTGLAELGRRTNALCKVGDFTRAAGPSADHRRCDAILNHVITCFGEKRLVFGSNWPVSSLHQAYPEVLKGLLSTAGRIGPDPESLARTMSDTALRGYPRLVPPASG